MKKKSKSFQDATLQIDKDYSYYKLGKGRPFLVISGFHTDYTRMAPLLTILSRYFTVYFPLLPGIHNHKALDSNNHTSKNYAGYLLAWIKKLELEDYVLSGFCYGALIAIRMLQTGNTAARSLFLVAPLYNSANIHIEKYMQLLVKLVIKLGPVNNINNKLVDFIMHNERFLKLYFSLRYRSESNIKDIIDHQISLTTMMNTKAIIDMVIEIFTLNLTSENLKFNIPTIMVINKTDNIFDVPKIKQGISGIFPDIQVFEIQMKEHAPSSVMKQSTILSLISPILPAIIKL